MLRQQPAILAFALGSASNSDKNYHLGLEMATLQAATQAKDFHRTLASKTARQIKICDHCITDSSSESIAYTNVQLRGRYNGASNETKLLCQ